MNTPNSTTPLQPDNERKDKVLIFDPEKGEFLLIDKKSSQDPGGGIDDEWA